MNAARLTPKLSRSVSGVALGALFLVLGAHLLVSGGCSGGDSTDRPDVLLLTIDTLRGDAWGCLGDPEARTPVFDRVARGGVLAHEGRAPVPVTLPSHTSMLTGLPPASHGVRDNGIFRLTPDEGSTLAERLGAAGYSTGAFVSAYPLTAPFGLDRGFDRYDSWVGGGEDVLGVMRQRRAEQTVSRMVRWLSGARREPPDPAAPLFIWVHFYDPHAEYDPPGAWGELFVESPYRGEVAYADRQFGRVLAALDRLRPGRRRYEIVTSDHGEGLGEHGESTHGALLHLTTIRIPIVARTEKYAPRLVSYPVSVERIAATVLEAAGLSPELNEGGAPPLEAPPEPILSETLYPYYNFGWRGLRSWERDGWRLVSGATDRLYRVTDDPGERRDLAAENPEVVERLRAELEETWTARSATAFRAAERELSPEDTEALRSLGYAAGATTGEQTPEEAIRSGPDPSLQVHLVDRLNFGTTLLRDGHYAQAADVLDAVVLEDPTNRHALQHLGRALRELGRMDKARVAYRRAFDLGPSPLALYLDLAYVEDRLGRTDAEWDLLVEALALHPASTEVRGRMARALLMRDQPEEALALLEKGVELRPRATKTHMNLAAVYLQLDRPEDAVKHWNRVIELDPDGRLGRTAREEIEKVGGQVER